MSPAKKVPGVVEAVASRRPTTSCSSKVKRSPSWLPRAKRLLREGVAAIKVEYEVLPHYVNDTDLAAAKAAGMTGKGGKNISLAKEPGDDDDEDEFTEKEINRCSKSRPWWSKVNTAFT